MTKASDNAYPSILVTEGTEPSAPAAGKQRVYIDSTTHILKATNSSGVERSLEGGGELDYVQFTSNVSVTATVEASSNTIVTATAITFDGTSVVYIEFFAPGVAASSGAATRWCQLNLFDGSSAIGGMAFVQTPAAATNSFCVHAYRRLTPTNAAHTYSVRGMVDAGTSTVLAGAGGAGVLVPGFIRISRAS